MSDRRVLLLVSAILGVLAGLGMVLTYMLVKADDDGAVIAGPMGVAIGALATLATGRTRQGDQSTARASGQAEGYAQAQADLRALTPTSLPPEG